MQDGNQVDYFGWLGCFLWLFLDLFSAGFNFLFDHFHERLAIIVAIFFRFPLRAHAVDERFRHVHLPLPHLNLFREVEFARIGEFFGEVHQLENEYAVFRFNAGEILPRFDHNLRDADFLALCEGIPQKGIGFVPSFLRLQIIGLVEKNRVDLFLSDEVLDFHGLRCFQVDPLKILIFEHDVFPLFVFVTFHNFVPRNFLAVLFGDTLVIHRTQIAFAQQTKLEFLASRSGIKSDWNVNQPETDAAFPDCACHTQLFRMSFL